jgi:hypothetical protein
MRTVDSGKKTSAVLYSKQGDLFVPDWDSKPGFAQHSGAVAARAAMGQKTTPMGQTTLKESK